MLELSRRYIKLNKLKREGRLSKEGIKEMEKVERELVPLLEERLGKEGYCFLVEEKIPAVDVVLVKSKFEEEMARVYEEDNEVKDYCLN